VKKLLFFLILPFVFPVEAVPTQLALKSDAFSDGGMITSKYTCDGSDMSPPLAWTKGPEGTKSYAVIVDDPDAPMGSWVHWVVYNIPAGVTALSEGVPKVEKLQDGTLQGKNDFRRSGYRGPCPPSGTHRYIFKVYALDVVLKAGPGLTRKQLLQEMDGHVLAQGALTGKYAH
jgi:Raf kinase inhibitor-like YbhB/YbcL family protein